MVEENRFLKLKRFFKTWWGLNVLFYFFKLIFKMFCDFSKESLLQSRFI